MTIIERPLDFNLIWGLGMPDERRPETQGNFRLPPDTVVVSADCHYSLEQDIWYEKFPARLKDKAPRVWRDERGVCQVGWNGVSPLGEMISTVFSRFETMPGARHVEARIADMDKEGVDKEIVFPNALLVLMHHGDLDVRDWALRIYNEHLAELQQQAPGRFYGVGFINFWDTRRTADSIAELKALGLKTFLLPQNPGSDCNGNKIHYHGDDMRPVWEAIEDSGLPICFHIGENIIEGPRGEANISSLMNFAPFRKTVGELTFGGILDRHPRLQVAFIEAGINWVAGVLQDMEVLEASFHQVTDWKLQKEPRSYWFDHMHASFMTDKLGLRLLDVIGADKVMWSTDYPHPESTFGYSWTAMNEVVKATTPDNARKILGGTAMKLFKL